MQRPRVLVLEDQKYLREIMVEVLEDSGYAATGIAGAAEALERLPILRPDLIVMDLSMPGMHGHEFLARLRADALWADLPVLVVSALDDTGLRPVDQRGVTLLQKPFDVATLLEYTRRLLGSSAIPGPPRRTRPADLGLPAPGDRA